MCDSIAMVAMAHCSMLSPYSSQLETAGPGRKPTMHSHNSGISQVPCWPPMRMWTRPGSPTPHQLSRFRPGEARRIPCNAEAQSPEGVLKAKL